MVCPLGAPLDSVLIAGLGGDDTLRAEGFPITASVVLAGGEGSDELTGGQDSEDVLVDGPGAGADTLSALGGDDALLHNGGADELLGGDGNDLFLSNSVCDRTDWSAAKGATTPPGRASGKAIGVNVGAGESRAARARARSRPAPAGPTTRSEGIEDLEGSNRGPGTCFYGGPDANQLLGHARARRLPRRAREPTGSSPTPATPTR